MSCLYLFVRYRWLIWNLVSLDFKVRHAGSRFGLLWVLLAPTFVLASYVFVFGAVLRVKPIADLSALEYGLLVACGLLPWIGFSEGVTSGTSSVLAQRNLMKSRLFPMELIPVTSVCTGLVGQLCSTGLLLVTIGFKGMLGVAVLIIPVLLLMQTLLTIGLVWFLSCVNILYRDITQIVGLGIVLLMFVSPIAYTREMVPAGLEPVMRLNPLAYLIQWYREAIFLNHVPDVWSMTLFAALTVLVLEAGYLYFMRLRRVLPDFV